MDEGVLRGQRYDFLSYGIMELWRMRLCDDAGMGGLRLLAVDVDGYPASVAVCHGLKFCGL